MYPKVLDEKLDGIVGYDWWDYSLDNDEAWYFHDGWQSATITDASMLYH